jgi:hypothetical protein
MDNLPTTAIGAIRLLANTQVQIDVMSDQLIESVRQGEVNPLEVLVTLKAFEKVADRVLKEIRDNFVTESNKYPERIFEFAGNKIEKAEVGTKYDYSICNDPIYNFRLDISKKANEQLKEREEFLKTLKNPMTVVDDDSGEITTITPPFKTYTTSLKVTIK